MKLTTLTLAFAILAQAQTATPSIPLTNASCLPAGMAGPQLPSCFPPRAHGGNGLAFGIVVTTGSAATFYLVKKLVRRHRRNG